MLSVAQAAELLGVSGARVRAMLASGLLEGEKIGRAWAVSAASVRKRLVASPRPGRPAKEPPGFTRECPDIEEAHALYDKAARLLAGCYNAEFLSSARDNEEQAFWVLVSDFFLQQRQKELVDQGVF